MDPSGTLWILDSCAGQVIAYNPSTGAPTGASVLDSVSGQTNPTAVYMTFDGSGNLWLAGNTSAGIEKFTPPLTISSVPVATISSGVSTPLGLAFDPAGNLYVANYFNSNVTAYVPSNGATPFATIPALNPIVVKVTP
jgi:streptogramin lyase